VASFKEEIQESPGVLRQERRKDHILLEIHSWGQGVFPRRGRNGEDELQGIPLLGGSCDCYLGADSGFCRIFPWRVHSFNSHMAEAAQSHHRCGGRIYCADSTFCHRSSQENKAQLGTGKAYCLCEDGKEYCPS